MIARLWEWEVTRETRSNPVGVCTTEQAAMHALSKALITAGCPARGQVGRVTLVRPVNQDSLYVREPPQRTACYDGSVISWT